MLMGCSKLRSPPALLAMPPALANIACFMPSARVRIPRVARSKVSRVAATRPAEGHSTTHRNQAIPYTARQAAGKRMVLVCPRYQALYHAACLPLSRSASCTHLAMCQRTPTMQLCNSNVSFPALKNSPLNQVHRTELTSDATTGHHVAGKFYVSSTWVSGDCVGAGTVTRLLLYTCVSNGSAGAKPDSEMRQGCMMPTFELGMAPAMPTLHGQCKVYSA